MFFGNVIFNNNFSSCNKNVISDCLEIDVFPVSNSSELYTHRQKPKTQWLIASVFPNKKILWWLGLESFNYV